MTTVNLGDKAPDFKLRANSGDMVTLSEQHGSKVILAFFPASFTGVCETELCTFRDSLASFNDMNCKVFGISVDPPFSQVEFASKNDLAFPLLSDFTRQTVTAYGVELQNLAGIEGYNVAQRSVFVVDGEGAVRWRWIAESPLNEPPYDEIKAAVAAL